MAGRERYSDRVRRAWRELHETQEDFYRVSDDANEQRVHDARSDLFRALSGMRPVPPEVREAQRRLDEDYEDWVADGERGDPVREERNLELQRQLYAAEDATGYRPTRRERQQLDAEQREDFERDQKTAGDWWEARQATVWGVIQPDGSVQAKGFVGDDTADDDQAVYPPGAIAYYGASGWTNAGTGHPASRGPAQPESTPTQAPPAADVDDAERRADALARAGAPAADIDAADDETERLHQTRTKRDAERTAHKNPDLADLRRGTWYDEKPITTTGSTGGTGMSSIEEVRAGVMAANESANEALGALQQAHTSLETAQGGLLRATEGSGQADVSEANGLLAQAVNSIEEVRQQVSAAISAAESVANRL